MKKVLITITGLRFELNEGAKHRLYSFIDCYKKMDYEVTVLVFSNILSYRFVFKKHKFLRNDVKWIIYPSFPVAYNKFLFFTQKLFSQIVIYILTRIKYYDILQSELACIHCKYKNKKTKLIVDFHGDSYEEYLFRSPRNNQIAILLKNSIVNSITIADHIIVVSENLLLQFENYYNNKICNYSIISCGVDINRFEDTSKRVNINNINIGERIVLGYSGGLQKWQNIEFILDIFIKLKEYNNRFFFMLYTNSDTGFINEKLKLIGENNYLIMKLTFDEVPEYLKLFDAGFLIREDLILNKVSSPTKILEYLAAGVPVICTKFSGDYLRSIQHLKNGFVLDNYEIKSEDIFKLAYFLFYIKQNREKFREDSVSSVKDRTFWGEFLTLAPFLQS